jgi:hypothetical protein
MLRNWVTHKNYQQKFLHEMEIFRQKEGSRLALMAKSLMKLYLFDLDSLLPSIIKLYADDGRPAVNQQQLMRSLVLMPDLGYHSITVWAGIVAGDPIISAACGFERGKEASFSSYYDIINRFWLASHEEHVKRKSMPKSFFSKPRQKFKAGQKLPPKHTGSVAKLASLAERGKLREERPEMFFQQFLARCVVDVSAKMGILGDTNAFSTAMDGSCYYSGASHSGVKVCNCRKKGIYDCKCKRRYSDPDARWGWDSYRERYFFGDTLFTATASDSPYDLPVYLRIAQAQRHDSILTIFALSEIRKLYPDFKFKNLIADGAMDNYATYRLLHKWRMIPFIPLDSDTRTDLKSPPPGVLCFDDKGRPICPGGIPYHNCGFSFPKGIKYRCWFDCFKKDKPCKCSDSLYGRTVYIKPGFDLRLFPPVPRDSDAFKNMFKTRTTAERSNKRVFIDYRVEDSRSRSSRMRFAFATFAAVNIHLDAWIKHTGLNLIDLLYRIAGTAT